MVARTGYRAMKHGEGDVVAGMKNKVQAAMSAVTPQSALAEMHRGMAEPGSGEK
jgi:short-subunit dehydrogenase